MMQRAVVESLKRQYLWLDGHFNELFQSTTGTREKDILRAAYLGSRRNLLAARAKSFMEDDPTASLLHTDLIRNQEQVELLAATGDGTGLVALIAAGVGLGSRLSGCGADSDS
jgi:hypothetical protein